MSDVLMICPYCGNEYGDRLGCCGEHYGHAVFVIDDDESDVQYHTREEALAAIGDGTPPVPPAPDDRSPKAEAKRALLLAMAERGIE